MKSFELPLAATEPDYIAQVEYAMSFASEWIASYECRDGQLRVRLRDGADVEEARDKVSRLLERYADRRFGLKEVVHFKQERDLPVFDAWSAPLERRWVTPVGPGHVVLRGLAAQLQRVIETKVLETVAARFGAEEEFYPSTILCRSLDRINHFTSFPEHVDFVAHLREDVDVLGRFAQKCREEGWKPDYHDSAMSPVDFAICPSCCYHCYESMENWNLQPPGRSATMVVNCHRYEAGNLTTMSRLRAFHQRDVVWVGQVDYVRESRSRTDEMLIQWAKDWELDCQFENANDMFFTADYSVKASFQRQQEAKRELRARIPFEKKTISVSSSNFHGATFGKAFSINVDGRTAASACVGWGYERWVYAVFSQFGVDPASWPAGLREDYSRYSRPSASARA
jgi:hypothetical protein